MLVLLCMVLVQGQGAAERSGGQVAAPLEPIAPPASAPGARPAAAKAHLVRDERFTLAVPAGWSVVPAPPGAAFAARSGDGAAAVSVRVAREPDLTFGAFAQGARGAFARDLDGRRVRLVALRPQGETRLARLAAAPAPGQPAHTSLLAARGPLRYQLTSSVAASAEPAVRRQARLLTGSFTAEAAR